MTETETQPSNGPLAMLNIGDDGDFPTERIPDASDARSILSTLILSNRQRARLNAMVKGMIDGEKPFNSAKLRASGQGDVSNVCWLEGGAKCRAAHVPFYDLFSASAHYAEFKTDFGSIDDQVRWSQIMTDEADYTFKSWKGFDWEMQKCIPDCVDFGKGFLMHKDKDDFRFSRINQADVLFPDGTESDPEKWEVFVIRHSFKVNELANYIRNRDAAKTLGWNVEAVEDAIYNARPVQPGTGMLQYDYNSYQQMVKDHDVMQGIRCPTVQGAYVYVKEFDGKITKLIVTETESGKRPNKNYDRDIDNFLFKSVGKIEAFSEIITPFIYEVLDGSINGTQGLGHLIYAPMRQKDILINAAVGLGIMRSGITLQAKTAGAYQKMNLVRFGRIGVIPPDFDVLQSGIMGDMEAPLGLNRALDVIVDNNTGVYRSERVKEQGNPRTKFEVQAQIANSTVLSSSAVARFFQSLDKLYDVSGRRLCNTKLPKKSSNEGIQMAIEFQERCMDRGVPKEAFDEICSVRAYRPSGNGSPFMRQQSVMGLAPFVPMFPENGKQRWLQDAVAVAGNQDMVDRYVPESVLSELPTDQMNLAMLENAALKLNAPVTWTPTQNNVIHAQIHLGAASGAEATLPQGADSQEVLNFLQAIGQHVIQHIQALSQDPMRQNEFKVLSKQWEELAKTTDQLAKHVEQQREQAAQNKTDEQKAAAIAAGIDPETKIKIESERQDMIIKRVKNEQIIGNKQKKFEADMALKNAQAAHGAILTEAKTKQQMALDDARTAADINRQIIESSQKATQQ